MMFKEKFNRIIKAHNSLLCVGLDCDLGKIPKFLLRESDPLLTFNREIIQAISGIPAAFCLSPGSGIGGEYRRDG